METEDGVRYVSLVSAGGMQQSKMTSGHTVRMFLIATVVYSSVLLPDRLQGARSSIPRQLFPNATCFAIYRHILVFNNIRFANVLS